MEFVAKLDDQISEPAAAAAAAQEGLAAATRAADAQLRALDSTQQKAARRAELSAKAFNPKAYQQQIRAERELAGAKEQALQGLKLGLSQKEKDEAAAKKAAAEERARAREAAAQKAAAGLGGAAAQAKALALSLGAVAGVSGGLGLAKIAIGYQGMARLQAITYQAGVNFRSLFRGVDSRPLERAYLQFTKLFSLSTTTGKGLSSLMTRGFNALFQAIEKAEPYVSDFVRGAYGGVLDLEYAWLRARVALLPVTDALEDAMGKVDGLKVAATGGAVAVGLLGVKAGIAAAPFVALAAAIGSVVAAADQFNKLTKEWDGDLVLRSIGIGESDADRMNRQFDEEAAARRRAGKKSLVREVDSLPIATAAPGAPPVLPRALPAPAPRAELAAAVPSPLLDKATGDGRRLGGAIGDGVAVGLKLKERALYESGLAAAGAVQSGVQDKAGIHSPARAFISDAEQMGKGTEIGLKKSQRGVQKAAEESLVPSMRSAATTEVRAAPAAAAPAVPTISLSFSGDINVGAGVQISEVRESFDESMAALAQQVGVMLGMPRTA